MDNMPCIYETEDMTSLVNDYLSFSKFDKNYIIVCDSRGLPSPSGLVDCPLKCVYYIKPGKHNSVTDSILYITTLFNEHSPITVGSRNMSLTQIIDTLSHRLL